MKKLLVCLITAMLLGLPAHAAASGPVIVYMEPAEVRAGERAEVVVRISNNPGISGAAFTLRCPSEDISLGEVRPLVPGYFSADTGLGCFSWLGGSDIEGDTALAVLCLDTAETAFGQYELSLELTGGLRGNLTNSRREEVAAAFSGGVLTVSRAAEPGQSPSAEVPGGAEEATESPMAEFSDLEEGAWYQEGVGYVLREGIMDGVGGGRFAPEMKCSRAMIVTMLYRAAGSPEVTGGSPFTDVAEGKWYADATAWAWDRGIAEGYGGGLFAPGREMSREQLALMLFRFTAEMGGDISARTELSRFRDGDSVHPWAREAVEWAVGCGLMEGRSDSLLDPRCGTTRAEAAVMLLRWHEMFKSSE